MAGQSKESAALWPILQRFRVPRDGVLVVHSAIGLLSRQGFRAEAMIEAFLDHLSGGNLFMPTMTWGTGTLAQLRGLAGAAGLVVLILALQGPARGAEYGVSAFGPAAAALVALALVMGLVVLILARRFRRTSGLVIAIHSTIAVTAFVLLLAYVSFS